MIKTYYKSRKFGPHQLYKGWRKDRVERTWRRRLIGTKHDIARDCYSLDHSVSIFLVPRLKFLRDAGSHPGSHNYDEWCEILDKMIKGFEFVSSDKYFATDNLEDDEINEALQLFAKHFASLWY